MSNKVVTSLPSIEWIIAHVGLYSIVSYSLKDGCPVWLDHDVVILCTLHNFPRSGELRTLKLKSHLVRTQSLNVLPLKPGVGQYIA
ncbi:hypothetical protein, partial [Thiolapillus sp.]|uniref:hypothetical protein n=1 Tax=Thiolapillus sp. TaxID=2017437 RepID=UPI003AF6AE37